MYSITSRFFKGDVEYIVTDFIEKKLLREDNFAKFLAAKNQEALIITSVANFCKTQIRLNKKRESVSLDEISALNLPIEPEMSQVGFSDDLKQILSTLPDRQRTVIEKSIEGYDDAEIADYLKTTINSVRQMKCRARIKIREALDD